jgi:hypothetical protein
MQNKKKKHMGKKHCGLCKSDVEVNRKWAEAMGMDRKVVITGKDDYLGSLIGIERAMRNLSLGDGVTLDRCVEVNT